MTIERCFGFVGQPEFSSGPPEFFPAVHFLKENMRRFVLVLIFLLAGPVWAATTDTLTRHAITWTFDGQYEYGTFANGDYWVVGPLTIIGITPASTVTAGRTINGSMLDPNSGQGFDSASSIAYTAAKNVARPGGNDLSAGNPLVIASGHSLVSAKSATAAGARPTLTDASVLTILTSAPDVNSFRPAYAHLDKTINFNVSDVNYSSLAALTPTASAPSLATAEGWFERVWLDWIFTDQYIKPSNNMPKYGRDIAVRTGDGALVLNLNYTNAQKEALLIRYVQLGIDLYGIIQADKIHAWQNSGGFSHGRKLPILTAGLILDDAEMEGVGALSGDYLYSGSYGAGNNPPDYIHFGEDDQTFYVTADDIYSQPYTLNHRHMGFGSGTQTGHVTVTNGSTAVVGVGTLFIDGYTLSSTCYFGVVNDVEAYSTTGRPYRVTSRESNTQLTLTVPYRGDTDQTGNAHYKLADYVYYGHGEPYSSPYTDFNEFTLTDVNIPSWGVLHATQPLTAGPDWESVYQTSVSYSYNGNALAAIIMGLKTSWNHDAFFDYTDRWVEVHGGSSLSDFAEEMWDSYRVMYPPIWPDANEPEEPDPNNNAPVLAAIGNKSVLENRTLTFAVSASDADANDLTYSFGDTPPTGATLVGTAFSWTPTYRDSGTYNVNVRVTDGELWDSEIITITVTNVPVGLITR